MSLRNKFFFLVLFFFSFTILLSQGFPSQNQYYIFLDAKTNEIKIVENDSIIYTRNFQNPHKLIKFNYPENLLAYPYQFSINKKNYFVNAGCGGVLEFKEDTVKRVDNSFLHKNQFEAADFKYKNEMYLFGGYGIFTLKNIITRYDFKTKEWFQVVFKDKERPVEGHNYGKIVIGDELFVFGGLKQKIDRLSHENIKPNTLWKFNFKKSTWQKLGTIDLKYDIDLNNFYNINTFNWGDKIYIFDDVYSAIIDIKKNKIYYFKTNVVIRKANVIYNPKDKTVNFLDLKSSTRKTVLNTIPLSDFLKEPVDEEAFYSPLFFTLENAICLLVILIILIVLINYLFRKRKSRHPKNEIIQELKLVYNESRKSFSCNNFTIQDFTNIEKSVLIFLLQHRDSFFPIQDINFIIEREMNSHSINSLLRKREAIINSIKTKISFILNIPSNEVILEKKNTQDKRIKEIKLNNSFLVVEK